MAAGQIRVFFDNFEALLAESFVSITSIPTTIGMEGGAVRFFPRVDWNTYPHPNITGYLWTFGDSTGTHVSYEKCPVFTFAPATLATPCTATLQITYEEFLG
jgi:hypothetical protein